MLVGCRFEGLMDFLVVDCENFLIIVCEFVFSFFCWEELFDVGYCVGEDVKVSVLKKCSFCCFLWDVIFCGGYICMYVFWMRFLFDFVILVDFFLGIMWIIKFGVNGLLFWMYLIREICW